VQSLHQFSLALAAEHSPEAAARRCVAWLVEAPGMALARLWLGEPSALQLEASAEPASRVKRIHWPDEFGPAPPPDGVIGRLVRARESLAVENLQGDPGWKAHHDWLAREGIVGFGGVPLEARGEWIGAVAVFRRRPVDRSALATLSTAAGHAAAAIERGRAFSDLERRRRELATENAWLRSAMLQATDVSASASILTEPQMRDFARENTEAALRRCRGKLYGEDGAARLLGVSPTTLASRIKKMGLVPDS
jgi:GAF domain-containing protein